MAAVDFGVPNPKPVEGVVPPPKTEPDPGVVGAAVPLPKTDAVVDAVPVTVVEESVAGLAPPKTE